MVNDSIGDLIIRLKNASTRGNLVVETRWTKMSEAIGLLLVKEGYLTKVDQKEKDKDKSLIFTLRYDQDSAFKAISGIKRVSKPGVRRYSKSKKISKVLSGLGMVVISTSKGIMSGVQAKKESLGGEILFQIW